MEQKSVIFRDREIIEFCTATKDTNQIHDPEIMTGLGKRVIVPGMFVLSCTINLASDFLKSRANTIRVYFNSLLSAEETVTLGCCLNPELPDEIRLSATNHKDTLTSKHDYTRIQVLESLDISDHAGILRRLEVTAEQVKKFTRLIGAKDQDVSNFLFAVSYASQALLRSIHHPVTEIEAEIEALIHTSTGVSPFYHALEINIPESFPIFDPEGYLDYFIHFEREKKNRLYVAHLRCEHAQQTIFHAKYNLMGIADLVILRMAREIHRSPHPA